MPACQQPLVVLKKQFASVYFATADMKGLCCEHSSIATYSEPYDHLSKFQVFESGLLIKESFQQKLWRTFFDDKDSWAVPANLCGV